jgi:diguanylate cyclase (GGDEF)-like protein
MSLRAWIYIWGVLIAGGLVSWIAYITFSWDESYRSAFLVLLLAATAAQLCRVEGPNNILHYATPIFYFAALLLLPPFLFVAIVVVSLSIEWIKERLVHGRYLRHWYIQLFNMAMSLIAGFVAYRIIMAFVSNAAVPGVLSFGGVTVAALAYVLLHETMLGLALSLARNVPIRTSGVFAPASLFTELVLVLQGYVIAMLWYVNPLLIIAALMPLGIMYRALKIPQLEQQAQTDAKTGLMNARYFNERFAEELGRARRFNRPLAVIMGDLDLLRDINNRYGHLAGDAVLIETGHIIRRAIREYDIAARFGGEEFAIILPEADVAQAQIIAERIRHMVEMSDFVIPTQDQPIRATMSLGVACFPQDATEATDLQHQADVAAYQAKSQGRNRVVMASDIAHPARRGHERAAHAEPGCTVPCMPPAAQPTPPRSGDMLNDPTIGNDDRRP